MDNIKSVELQLLDVPGGRLAYDVTGPDHAGLVLCVAGMGDTRAAFRFLAPKLVEAGYRVARMDQRGHGASSATWAGYGSPATGEDMLALIRHLSGPATIIGHSNAAAAAIWAAAQEPGLVSGLALVDPFLQDGKMSPILRLAEKIVTGSPWLWTRFYYPSLYKAAKPADFDEYLVAMRASLHEPGRMAALRGVATEQERCRARIPELRCPVRIVMGTKDPDFPDAVVAATKGEALVGQYTEVSLELIEGAGHYPHAEVPEVTASAILPFLADVVSA
jgi:pimeloyl-ACP methyl ester carboxylesterase